jgi:O-antigen/teichoic acid export membrane protein
MKTALGRRLPDLGIVALLFLLPLILFWAQTLGGRTLIPTENLYQFEPYATYREVVKAPAIPYNALVSDLVLQNFQWKSFIRESLAMGEIPLWNPHQFSGIPFLAAGQQSTLYPFSLIYYVMPLTAAYGWFTVTQLWLAGVCMFLLVRGLGAGRMGGTLAGVVYQLSGFFVVSAVFPMIIAAAAWIPLVLLMVEFIIRQQPALRGRPASIPWVVIGAGALGCSILAGHVEITYYTLLMAAFFAAARLLMGLPQAKGWGLRLRWLAGRSTWLVLMVALGMGLGAAQFIPLFEYAGYNYRDGRTTLDQVLGWAHPLRGVIQYLLPNVYGSPTLHSYLDVFSGQMVTAFTNLRGEPITTIDWGIKNYVEGALYVGILPLALALYRLFRNTTTETQRTSRGYGLIFMALTGVALTFMFGLPTYALLYYGLPGINQLHSPFRWVLAVTLGVAVLAGLGADALARGDGLKLARRFGWVGVALGGLTLAGLVITRLAYEPFAPLFQRLVESLALADQAFSDGRMFYSVQFFNVLMLGGMLLGAGVVLLLAGGGRRWRGMRLWQPAAVGLVAVDLMLASGGFNPASDPALLDFTPPSIGWLKDQPGDWRYISIDEPALGERGKILNANMTWRYGLDDVRGYESIIPKPYVETMWNFAPQVQLDFNRVAPLYPDYQYDAMGYPDFSPLVALQSPLMRFLNIRYVVTSKQFDLPAEWLVAPNSRSSAAWELAYEDEAVRIWQNHFSGTAAGVLADADLGTDSVGAWAEKTGDSGREKFFDFTLTGTEPTWFIAYETYMPGWRAFIRPKGAADSLERPLEVERVRGNFQGVRLDSVALMRALLDQGVESGPLYLRAIDAALAANDLEQVEALRGRLRSWRDSQNLDETNPMLGQAVLGYLETLSMDALREYAALTGDTLKSLDFTIRLVYSPVSFQVGLFASVISAGLLALLVGMYVWRLTLGREDASGVQVVARNSLAPILLNLFNRGIDFAFALVMLRVLGPEGSGIYTYAAFIFIWFDIFTNFGLNVFLTREVARDTGRSWHLFFNTSVMRLALMGVGVPLLVGFLAARQGAASMQPLAAEAVAAIGLLYLGLLPNSLSTGMSALFYAYQKAEYPAAISTVTSVCKVILQLIALLAGWGVVGLAAMSIVTNTITLGVMLWVGRSLLGGEAARRDWRPDWRLIRGMIGEGWPLMLNHFLATIFFQIDVLIIQAAHGDRMVGQYGVAYKWISALNVIPAFFTMALLPVLSRMAREDRDLLKRNYGLAVKLLVGTALPIAVLFTFLAYALTGVLGGAEFLPDGAIATQIMIWSIPIGWINSLTQYVLIALDLQRRITGAFMVAVTFNIVSNLILIPPYGYRAAALTTIASEAVLLGAFSILLIGGVGGMNWLHLLWKLGAAALVMFGVLALGWNAMPALSLVGGVAAYGAALAALRPLNAQEVERLLPLLPGRARPWVTRWAG